MKSIKKSLGTLVIAMLIAINVKAQFTCQNALQVNLDTTYHLQYNDTTYFSFVALGDSLAIGYTFLNCTTEVSATFLLKNSCSGGSLSNTQLNGETNAIMYTGLTQGQGYKLKLVFANGYGLWHFALGHQPDAVESNCISALPDCELVCNGNFETLEANTPPTSTQLYPYLQRMNRWGGPLGAPFSGSADSYWFNGSVGNVPYKSNYLAPFGRNNSNGVAGLLLHASTFGIPFGREYAQTKLVEKMKPGHRYIASMWLRHYENTMRQIDRVGMLFTSNPISQNPFGSVITSAPQIERSGTVFGNNWTQVTELIENQSSNSWEYLTIGNFTTDTSNMVYLGWNPNMVSAYAYYFFDDISVIEVPSAGTDTSVCTGTQVSIGKYNCDLPLGVNMYWADLQGNVITSTFPLTQVFNQTQTFVLHVNYLGLSYTDTITVSVDCCSKPVHNYQFMNSESATNAFPGVFSISNSVIVLNKTFTLNKTMTFTNCHFYMGPNAEIIVTSGVTFNLDSCIFESCDGINMWNGITLQQNSALADQNCTYKEAKTAIKSIFGAAITTYRSNYVNNQIGINIKTYFGFGFHPLNVDECLFQVNGTLLEPYAYQAKSTTGILLEDVNNVRIGRQMLNHPDEFNKFINLKYGIKAIRSNAIVETNLFAANDYGVFADGYTVGFSASYYIKIGHHNGAFANKFQLNRIGVYLIRGAGGNIEYNDFINNHRAISIKNQPNNRSFIVFSNILTDNLIGIEFGEIINPNVVIEANEIKWQGVFNRSKTAIVAFNAVQPSSSWIPNLPGSTQLFTIYGNTIEGYYNGIAITNIAQVQVSANEINYVPANWNKVSHGIKLFNCPMAQITQNIVRGTNPCIWAGHGIASDFARDNLIEGNCVKDLGRGLWVGGYSGGVKIISNVMKNCNTGFFGNWSFIGMVEKVINTGGSVALLPADNKWDGQFTYHMYNHQAVTQANGFRLRTAGSINYDPRFNPSPLNNAGIPIFNNQQLTVTATSAGIDTYTIPMCESGNVSFKVDTTDFIGLTPDEIAQIADTSSLQAYTPDDIAIEWLLMQSQYRELVQDTLNFYNNSLLASFIGATSLTNIGEIENIDQLVNEGIESGSLTELAAANAINNVLSTSELPANTTHNFYGVYINQLEEQDMEYVLDAGEHASLVATAALCPYIYGSAVYQARALLSIADTAYEAPVTPCEMGYLNGTAKTDGQPVDAEVSAGPSYGGTIKVSPNPSSGYVLVDVINNISTSPLRYVLIDITGRAIKQGSLNAEFSTFIDMSNLPNGVYMLQAFTNDELIGNEKIILAN